MLPFPAVEWGQCDILGRRRLADKPRAMDRLKSQTEAPFSAGRVREGPALPSRRPRAPPRAAGGKAARPCPQEERGGRPRRARSLRPGYCTHLLPGSCPGMSCGFDYCSNFDGELRCFAGGGRFSGSSPFGNRNAHLLRRQLAKKSRINLCVVDD